MIERAVKVCLKSRRYFMRRMTAMRCSPVIRACSSSHSVNRSGLVRSNRFSCRFVMYSCPPRSTYGTRSMWKSLAYWSVTQRVLRLAIGS
jgi:hypothetical protein